MVLIRFRYCAEEDAEDVLRKVLKVYEGLKARQESVYQPDYRITITTALTPKSRRRDRVV
jgi:hypothetical protein